MKFVKSRHLVSCAALCCLFAGVFAQGIDGQAIAPSHRIDAKQVVKPSATSKVDTKPPVLTHFSLVAPADSSVTGAQLVTSVTATDDLSGVRDVVIHLQGPSGQSLSSNTTDVIPAQTFQGSVGIWINGYTQPGVWTVSNITVEDDNGTQAVYAGASLAALGNPSVTVVNTHPEQVDIVAPVLVSGRILTQTLSVSTVAKGTFQTRPYIAASFTASDGGRQPSGLYQVQATFCELESQRTCFVADGFSLVAGLRKLILQAVKQVNGDEAGTYTLATVYLSDYAGNNVTLTGLEFGGTTNFASLLPDGHTITLTP